jgi:hypothetical protein
MLATQLVLPGSKCQAIGHAIKERLKQPGPGVYEYCATCTMGYGMALQYYEGDQDMADKFVQDLRRG